MERSYKFDSFDKIKALYNAAVSSPMDIDAQHDSYMVDAKSLMGLLTLDTTKYITIKTHTSDPKLELEFFHQLDVITS